MVATRRTPAKKKASSRSPSPAPRKKTPAKKSVSSRSPSPAPRKKTPAKRRSTAKKAPSGPGKELVGQRVEILWEKEKTWYGGTISKYNTRAGTHTIDYDDGETYIHDLRKTQYKASKVEEAGHLANTSAPDDAGTATDAELVTALLPQDGDCVSIKWAGAPDCICILRKDKAGDLIPVRCFSVDRAIAQIQTRKLGRISGQTSATNYPVDGSWEDENLVFDASKDEWEWPSDDALSSVKTESTQLKDIDNVKEEIVSVQSEDDSLNAPMHTLGTTVQVVFCAVAVGVACFFVDPAESDKLIQYVQNYTL